MIKLSFKERKSAFLLLIETHKDSNLCAAKLLKDYNENRKEMDTTIFSVVKTRDISNLIHAITKNKTIWYVQRDRMKLCEHWHSYIKMLELLQEQK